MRQARSALILLICLASGRAVAGAELEEMNLEKIDKDIAEAFKKSAGYAKVSVNGSLAGIMGARPKDIIELLNPNKPVIGLEHLPKDRFFQLTGLQDEVDKDALLRQLGETLGVTITPSKVTTEFLIVRNLTHPMPLGWATPGPPTKDEEFTMWIEEVDEVDHLVVTPSIDMVTFFNFLSRHTNRPILNQTGLGGRYQFSTVFEDRDVERLLKKMGFDVIVAKRTRECMMVAPKSPPEGRK